MFSKESLFLFFSLFAFGFTSLTHASILSVDEIERDVHALEFDVHTLPQDALTQLTHLAEQALLNNRSDLAYKADSIAIINHLFIGEHPEVEALYHKHRDSVYAKQYPEADSRLIRSMLRLFVSRSDEKGAQPYINKLLSLLKHPKLTHYGRAIILNTLGATEYGFDDHLPAIEYLKEAQALLPKVNVAAVNKQNLKFAIDTTLAGLYVSIKDYDKALELDLAGLKEAQDINDPTTVQIYHYSIGSTYNDMHAWAKGIHHGLEATRLAEAAEEPLNIAYSLEIVVKAQMELGRLDEAKGNLHRIIGIYEAQDDTKHEFAARVLMARVLSEKGLHEKAESMLYSAKNLTHYHTPAEKDAYYLEAAYLIAKQGHHYQEALVSHERLLKLKEDDFRRQRDVQIQRWMAEFEVDKANKAAASLKRDNQLKTLKLEEKAHLETLYLSVIVFGGVIVLLLGFFIYRERENKKQIHKMAMTDPLTGAPNRRFIETLAMKELDLACDQNTASFGLVDIDHFKSINDTYGHDTGDQALKHFVNTCTAILRKGDHVGRFGGEEFLLVLPNTSQSDVERVFARIQRALKETPLLTEQGESIALTFSMGAVVLSKETTLNRPSLRDSLSCIVKLADQCVYQAKDQGRDRLVFA